MDFAIKIENLKKIYKNSRGVENLNLEVPRGEIFGLLGPNGAGKTTAMKIMTGLLKPDSGDVFIDGYSITERYEDAMRGVGCIIENVFMFKNLTALENLMLCARFYKNVDEARMTEVLDLVKMTAFKNEKIKGFSLGMRQRMGIAMALLSRPDVLILDEPLNGLDVEGMVDIRNILKRLSKEEKTTVFISSHLIHDVELTCDRVGVLLEGRLCDVSEVSEVVKNFSSLENYYLSEVEANE